ncbi:hypothetical protein ABT147_05560 [Streptomyces sp. NPDC001868]|uniref:hypothetical protein n=1 Tax=Streptomyces sp. NPDC001868 TaxID=3154401 RepID=UPI00332E14BB
MVGALLTAFALLLLTAPPSAAGGPTSVLLVTPTIQRTASLYGTQEDYGRLEKLLAPAGSELDRSAEKAPEWGREDIWGERLSDMISVTWMIHDVTPWRLDRVYPAAPDTRDVWIHTTLTTDEETVDTPDGGVWHRAKQPEQLRKLLNGLGVLGTAPDDPALGEQPPADSLTEARSETDETAAASRATTRTPGLSDRARWAIPALALGLLLGAGGATLLQRRVAARHESGPPREPRQELLDA